uniref:NMP kinase n=1 Tax=Paramecium primaurelia TaxID=5886 RepID=O00846_PARPR|nr:NMP kinase [Paramecium primaurelia]
MNIHQYDLLVKFSTLRKPFVYFILGGPGSGKGTQCELLSKNLKYVHLSAGQLLRNAIKNNSEHKSTIENCINNGGIVPSHVTINLLDKAIFEDISSDTFLIDGFPRNYENMENWIALMDNKINFKSVIHILCSRTTMIQRITERSKTSGRSDDNIQTLEKRFIRYQNDTYKIIEHYRNKNQLIEINGDNSIEIVQREILESLNQLNNK